MSLTILCALSLGTLGAVLLTSQFKKDLKAAGLPWPSIRNSTEAPSAPRTK